MSEHININERITERRAAPPAHILRLVMYAFYPLEAAGLIVGAVLAVTHWHTFTEQSSAIFSWIVLFIGMVMYTLLAGLIVYVARMALDTVIAAGQGITDIHAKFTENRKAREGRSLLYTGDTYAVYLDKGNIAIHEIARPALSASREERQPAVIDADTLEQIAAPMYTFKQLLEQGIVQSALAQDKMLLGYGPDGAMRLGSWLDLYSCGIGGVSGSGKTTSVRFLLFQAVLGRARLVMIDPHMGNPNESLAAQFQGFSGIHILEPCDDSPAEVAKRVQWLTRECLRRMKPGAVQGAPVVFVLDEFNGLIRRLPDDLRKELASLLTMIAQEGRKFGIFAMIIAQRWSEGDLGGKGHGAVIRSSLASVLAHRFTDEDQAKKLIGGRNGPKCLELEQGHYFFRDTQGALSEMVTPYTAVEDGAVIQRLLAGPSTRDNRASYPTSAPMSLPTSKVPLQLRPVTSASDDSDDMDADTSIDADGPGHALEGLTDQEEQVLSLMREKRGQGEIVELVWGFKSTDGRPYRAALDEYRAVLASLAARIGA